MPVERRNYCIFKGHVLLPVPCNFIAKTSFYNRISNTRKRCEYGLPFSNSSNEKHYLHATLGKLLNYSGYTFTISENSKVS